MGMEAIKTSFTIRTTKNRLPPTHIIITALQPILIKMWLITPATIPKKPIRMQIQTPIYCLLLNPTNIKIFITTTCITAVPQTKTQTQTQTLWLLVQTVIIIITTQIILKMLTITRWRTLSRPRSRTATMTTTKIWSKPATLHEWWISSMASWRAVVARNRPLVLVIMPI